MLLWAPMLLFRLIWTRVPPRLYTCMYKKIQDAHWTFFFFLTEETDEWRDVRTDWDTHQQQIEKGSTRLHISTLSSWRGPDVWSPHMQDSRFPLCEENTASFWGTVTCELACETSLWNFTNLMNLEKEIYKEAKLKSSTRRFCLDGVKWGKMSLFYYITKSTIKWTETSLLG